MPAHLVRRERRKQDHRRDIHHQGDPLVRQEQEGCSGPPLRSPEGRHLAVENDEGIIDEQSCADQRISRRSQSSARMDGGTHSTLLRRKNQTFDWAETSEEATHDSQLGKMVLTGC